MLLWLWGGLGAFVFAVNALIFALWNTPGNRSGRYRACAEFSAALITGGVAAQGFTQTLQSVALHYFQVDSVAVALTIGWASNYVWPRLLRKLGKRIDGWEPKA